MTRLLLDTHVVLWQLGGDRDLSRAATEAIRSADVLYVSAVTFAEIGVKAALGKVRVPEALVDTVVGTGARLLPLEAEHGLAVAHLPMIHRDPFDRLLIAQARAEDLVIVTADRMIPGYDVLTIAA